MSGQIEYPPEQSRARLISCPDLKLHEVYDHDSKLKFGDLVRLKGSYYWVVDPKDNTTWLRGHDSYFGLIYVPSAICKHFKDAIQTYQDIIRAEHCCIVFILARGDQWIISRFGTELDSQCRFVLWCGSDVWISFRGSDYFPFRTKNLTKERLLSFAPSAHVSRKLFYVEVSASLGRPCDLSTAIHLIQPLDDLPAHWTFKRIGGGSNGSPDKVEMKIEYYEYSCPVSDIDRFKKYIQRYKWGPKWSKKQARFYLDRCDPTYSVSIEESDKGYSCVNKLVDIVG